MKGLHMVAFILVVIGGLNWGLVGLNDWNLVNVLVGSWPVVERVVYVLVGLGAVVLVFTHKGDCKQCMVGDAAPSQGMGGNR